MSDSQLKMRLTAEQVDFCSGVGLIYMGPENRNDRYVGRLIVAMKLDDASEAEHVSALMVVRLVGSDLEKYRYLAEAWAEAWKKI